MISEYKKQPDLSIIIVNWNTKRLLKRCLASIYETSGSLTLEVFVVDNGSTDGSSDMVRRSYPQVELIANPENLGYAEANNQAILKAGGRNILLLNSDTVVQPQAIQRLVDAMDNDPKVAVAGSQLCSENGDLQPSYGCYPNFFTEFIFQTFLFKILPVPYPYGRKIHPLWKRNYRRRRYVDWVSGAAMAMKSEALRHVGLLAGDTFMYGEDLDWCWRARQMGYKIKFCPDVCIIHHGSASAHLDYGRWIENYTAAMLNFFTCHSSKLNLKLISCLIIAGSSLRTILWGIVGIFKPAFREEARQRQRGYRKAVGAAWRNIFR